MPFERATATCLYRMQAEPTVAMTARMAIISARLVRFLRQCLIIQTVPARAKIGAHGPSGPRMTGPRMPRTGMGGKKLTSVAIPSTARNACARKRPIFPDICSALVTSIHQSMEPGRTKGAGIRRNPRPLYKVRPSASRTRSAAKRQLPAGSWSAESGHSRLVLPDRGCRCC